MENHGLYTTALCEGKRNEKRVFCKDSRFYCNSVSNCFRCCVHIGECRSGVLGRRNLCWPVKIIYHNVRRFSRDLLHSKVWYGKKFGCPHLVLRCSCWYPYTE